jgi:cation/acetate symporter
MRPLLARFSEPVSSGHLPSWADFITTTSGSRFSVLTGSLAGLLSSVGLVALSPGVWTATLKLGSAPFPYDNPALVSVPLAFAVSWAVSVLDRSSAATLVRASFGAQHVRAQTGLGIE